MSSMTSSATLALSENVKAALENLVLQEVLSQPHITGQDVRQALGNVPALEVQNEILRAREIYDLVDRANQRPGLC